MPGKMQYLQSNTHNTIDWLVTTHTFHRFTLKDDCHTEAEKLSSVTIHTMTVETTFTRQTNTLNGLLKSLTMK